MKLEKYLISTILLFVMICACQEENPISYEQHSGNYEIIGKWGIPEFQTIEFKGDGTFTESIYPGGTTNSSDPRFEFIQTHGNYIVENGVLVYTKIIMDRSICYRTHSIQFATNKIIDIKDGQWVATYVNVFTPEEEGNNILDGIWKQEVQFCDFHEDGDPIYTNGVIEYVYRFVADSSIYYCTKRTYDEVLDEETIISEKYNYDYEEPYIYLTPYNQYAMEVIFVNGKMYMLDPHDITYSKID